MLAFHVSPSAERAAEDVCTLGQFLTSHCFNLRLQVNESPIDLRYMTEDPAFH